MAKYSHVGKTPKEKQEYAEVLLRKTGESTVPDDIGKPYSSSSDVALSVDEETIIPSKSANKFKKTRLEKHFKKHQATYLVGIFFGMGSIAVVLYSTLGLPMYGDIAKISNQIETQQALNESVIEDITDIEKEINNSNSEIESKFRDIHLKLQEQSLKLEFLDRLVNESLP